MPRRSARRMGCTDRRRVVPNGRQTTPHCGIALHAGRIGAADAQHQLDGLILDRNQPAITRTSALPLLAPYVTAAPEPAIKAAIADPNPLVRLAAPRAFPASLPRDIARAAVPLLGDPVRAVCSGTPSPPTPEPCWDRCRNSAAKSRSTRSLASRPTSPNCRRVAPSTRAARMPWRNARHSSPKIVALPRTGLRNAGSSISRRRSSMSVPLLELQNVQKYFPVSTGAVLRHKIGWVKADDGVDLTILSGRDVGTHRRVGGRQDDDFQADLAAIEPHRRHRPL